MTPVIGVIVIVEITCQLPIAVALVPLTNSDKGEASSVRPPDGFSSDNKKCRASDNLPVTVESCSERVGQIVVIHFDKDSKVSWCRQRIIKINEITHTSLFVCLKNGLALYEAVKSRSSAYGYASVHSGRRMGATEGGTIL
ncbi:rCG23237 [Rattus norvegicus]|uniref:RCG23237 n=1 Tax=Rattus norvegicus TaxID=10116 RepID=A6JQ04_RAT|nr:rCG23237 [Rattus norvegicus]